MIDNILSKLSRRRNPSAVKKYSVKGPVIIRKNRRDITEINILRPEECLDDRRNIRKESRNRSLMNMQRTSLRRKQILENNRY